MSGPREQTTEPTRDVVVRAKAALEGVTYGPWEYECDSQIGPVVWLGDGDLCAKIEPHYQDAENGAFVAAARSLVPELVAALEAVRALAERWENATELGSGNRSIVAMAFASELRSVVGGEQP